MRRDGEPFPVELTITRIDVPARRASPAICATSPSASVPRRELRASRARLVEAADAARRRIERDLHDGAQQRLVSSRSRCGWRATEVERRPGRGRASCSTRRSRTSRRRPTELRELARGIHPAVLTEGGLEPALRGLVARAAAPARLVAVPAEPPARRRRGRRLLRRRGGAHQRRPLRSGDTRVEVDRRASGTTARRRGPRRRPRRRRPRGSGLCAAWPTASPRSTARSTVVSPRAAAPRCGRRSRAAW